jgi:hypothetical protein
MRNRRIRVAVLILTGCLLVTTTSKAADECSAGSPDYLAIVKAYADAMINRGRDVYGKEHSPLFAEELNRKTLQMLEGEPLLKARAIPYGEWGIRPHDRMLGGGNPQHCLNLYQILYGLSEICGDKVYADEADRSLKFFFEHCQSLATGLLYWGEHAGWDFRAEKPLDKLNGDIHEFYRPWVLWQRSWQLAPECCRRFALGLWEHQIGDHKTGDFSRHAKISSHGPGTEAPYARHGGLYIETWATAYQHTHDKVFLTAIESVLEGIERARMQEGGMLIGNNKQTGPRVAYLVSLAVSLEEAAGRVPADLAAKMRKAAAANDDAFAKAHGVSSRQAAQAPADWSNNYGGGGPICEANRCMLRYRQVRLDAYRGCVLQIADQYRNASVDLAKPVWPGTIGNVILLMLNAHELTRQDAYLQAAGCFARRGIELFLADGCQLPRASHVHDHYEAVTNGDTLMMAMLQLWLVQNRRESKVRLIYTDR